MYGQRIGVGQFLTRIGTLLIVLAAGACGSDDSPTSPDPGLLPEHLIGVWTLSLTGTCQGDPIDVVLQIMVGGATVDASTDTRLRFTGRIQFQGEDQGNLDGLADRNSGVFVAAASWIQFQGTVRVTGTMEGDWEDPSAQSTCTGDFTGNKA